MNIKPTIRNENTQNFARARPRPNFAKQARNRPAVSSSTSGNAARSVPAIGTSALQPYEADNRNVVVPANRPPQRGQCEPGATMDSSRGMRLMQTFRKLPKTSPATASTHDRKRSIYPLQSLQQGNLISSPRRPSRNDWGQLSARLKACRCQALDHGLLKRSKSPFKVISQSCPGGRSPIQFSSLRLIRRTSGSSSCQPTPFCSRT